MSGSKHQTDIDQKQFDALLRWLDPNREQAGSKYEEIRHGLMKIFAYRGWADSDYMADVTISRVASKVETIATQYEGDPARYFYVVAKRVHEMELRRRRVKGLSHTQASEANVLDSGKPDVLRCLDECLEALQPQDMQLILEYYSELKAAKVKARKRVAAGMGLSLTGMRIRVSRIRQTLAACVQKCLREGSDRVDSELEY